MNYNWYLQKQDHVLEQAKQRRIATPNQYLLQKLRARATRNDIYISILPEEIPTPSTCPLSGEPIEYTPDSRNKPYPVRIRSEAGFIAENVVTLHQDIGRLIGNGALFEYKERIDKFIETWQTISNKRIEQSKEKNYYGE
jgi:hypothetical protein